MGARTDTSTRVGSTRSARHITRTTSNLGTRIRVRTPRTRAHTSTRGNDRGNCSGRSGQPLVVRIVLPDLLDLLVQLVLVLQVLGVVPVLGLALAMLPSMTTTRPSTLGVSQLGWLAGQPAGWLAAPAQPNPNPAIPYRAPPCPALPCIACLGFCQPVWLRLPCPALPCPVLPWLAGWLIRWLAALPCPTLRCLFLPTWLTALAGWLPCPVLLCPAPPSGWPALRWPG